jgi:nicotinamidase-related amidase
VHEKFKPGLTEALLDRLCGGSGGLSGGCVDIAEFAPCSSDASFQPWRPKEMKKSALLVIDLQQETGSADESMTHIAGIGMEKILEHARLLIEQARADGIPVIYTRHVNRADGRGLVNREPVDAHGAPTYYRQGTAAVEIAEKIRPIPRDIVIEKRRQNAFYETELDMVLRSLGVSHLIVCGVVTDCCVFLTVQGAFDRNYAVTLIHDACGATSLGGHMAAVMIMANWVYDLEIASTKGWLSRQEGVQSKIWRARSFDEFAFTPQNMSQVYSTIEKL